MTPAIYTLIGVFLTLGIFVANVIFRTGQLYARVDELEKWRTLVRQDLHEVSAELQTINNNIIGLKTLIEERTERRIQPRP
jgi:sensor domain CHASE-containing protein